MTSALEILSAERDAVAATIASQQTYIATCKTEIAKFLRLLRRKRTETFRTASRHRADQLRGIVMCIYCYCGDHAFKFDPPWYVPPRTPYIPQPLPQVPVKPWDTDRLKEYLEILKQIKAMEDQIGCPCEPNKANYIKLFEERIAALEKKAAAKAKLKIAA